MINTKKFDSMTNEQLLEVDGGVGLLAAVLICGGCFAAGGIIVAGACFLLDKSK